MPLSDNTMKHPEIEAFVQNNQDLAQILDTTDDNDEVSLLSRTGYRLLRLSKLDEAEEQFKKIIELEDNNNYALVGLGDVARKRENYKAAIDFYLQCLAYYNTNNYALFGLADCYKSMGQYHKAIKIWEQYLEHDPHNITVLTHIADSYRKIHDFEFSKKMYFQALKLDPNNLYVLIGLGHLHYDFKYFRDALGYWKNVLQLSGGDTDIRVLTAIGNCYRKMKQFANGVIFFNLALEKDPNNFYGIFGLADCYRGLNQQQESIIYWEKLLEQDPHNKVILTRVGDAYRHLKDYEKAEECYQSALDIDYDSYAMLGLAILRKIQGEYEETITTLNSLMESDKKNYRIYVELADSYLKLNQKDKAREVLLQFQQFGIKNQTVQAMLNTLK